MPKAARSTGPRQAMDARDRASATRGHGNAARIYRLRHPRVHRCGQAPGVLGIFPRLRLGRLLLAVRRHERPAVRVPAALPGHQAMGDRAGRSRIAAPGGSASPRPCRRAMDEGGVDVSRHPQPRRRRAPLRRPQESRSAGGGVSAKRGDVETLQTRTRDRACHPCARTGRRRWSSSCRCRSRW